MPHQPTAEPIAQTLAAAAEGDAEAWRLLVVAYTRRVFALVYKSCGDRELAEEITQDTFAKIFTRLDGYREQGKFEPWLFRIAMNRLRAEMRRRKRQATPMAMTAGGSAGNADGADAWQAVQGKIVDYRDKPESPLDAMSKAEQIEQMKQAIATLPEADREILHLRHTAGLSFAEIAETLEQPLGTVLARGHRALDKLRKLLVDDHETQTAPRRKAQGQ